jgi:hypothetical protein
VRNSGKNGLSVITSSFVLLFGLMVYTTVSQYPPEIIMPGYSDAEIEVSTGSPTEFENGSSYRWVTEPRIIIVTTNSTQTSNNYRVTLSLAPDPCQNKADFIIRDNATADLAWSSVIIDDLKVIVFDVEIPARSRKAIELSSSRISCRIAGDGRSFFAKLVSYQAERVVK